MRFVRGSEIGSPCQSCIRALAEKKKPERKNEGGKMRWGQKIEHEMKRLEPMIEGGRKRQERTIEHEMRRQEAEDEKS